MISKRKPMVRKKRHRRSFRSKALSIMSIVLTAGFAYIFFFTGVFRLDEIRLHGGRYLPVDSIQAAADMHIGANIFLVSTTSIESGLTGFPEIREITLRRKPFHRIDCYLHERKPVALISLDEISGVDDSGIVIPCRSAGWNVDLPIITGIESAQAGSDYGKRMISKALGVLRLLKEFGFSPASELSEIHIEGEEVVLVWMGKGTLIKMGGERYLERVRKLRAVYTALVEQDTFPDLIDLRFERQVVIR